MANAAFLLLFGAIIIWLYSSGKLANIIAVITPLKTNRGSGGSHLQ